MPLRSHRPLLAFLLFFWFVTTGFAQPVFQSTQPALVANRWQNSLWEAKWLVHPTTSARAYGVYHFRKTISVTQKPARFMVHVSADNRYRLFVNGQAVAMGPARGDTQHWNYETVDLAPFMLAGANTLAAQVWHLGESAPMAQMSYQLGFVMQGDGDAEKIVNTNNTWKVYQNPAYSPVKNDMARLHTYVVVGDGDRVDGAQYPWGWEQPGFDDKAWPAAKPLWFSAKTRGLGSDGNWALVPRTIPPMAGKTVRLSSVRRAVNATVPPDFLQGKTPVQIPANTLATVLFDQKTLTNAYPELTVSAGKGASLTLTYAEGLTDAKGQKGNRNEVDGRTMLGIDDQFMADGGQKRTFRPLWFRTYRYLQLTVQTKDDPLTINDLLGQYTAYPFEQKARFMSPDTSLSHVWDVGWRTAQLCAGETYYDCPYYEQLQYIGDTRIQALISLYVSGDDRLMRKAILEYDDSRIAEGLTQSRYPSADQQVIPTFSLFWVCMVHDYWMHRKDDAFVSARLLGIESVLRWHESRIDRLTGLNGTLTWWNFVDWSWPWNATDGIGGVPDGAHGGGSSVLSLQQAYTYQKAADLFAHYGQNERAEHYRELARRINKAVMDRCWVPTKGLFADTPAKKQYSQHANIFAILSNAIPAAQQRDLLKKVLASAPADSLRPATYYFKFYLFQALKKTGLGDEFLPQLQPWHTMIANGLTTFAEAPEPTRSDCHAWSASPVYEFLSTVCGINPAEPGFRSVRIEPFLGTLPSAEGTMPHPSGDISVRFEKAPGGTLRGTVTLPPGLGGTLRWQGRSKTLVAGKQEVSL
ncbi:alpha-L-rhamnosidase-related protein [Fibrella aquatilis]|uniref:Alpha-L-rhamnosidase N-terminal domain-containing protein n=1 Tax=Fibrella aquatilis TaxID=2817059 RepID=A0A939G5I0_9BACT|nr:alpha-L-rhamnosidase C-terminal domain-containing protein [Fibrella aquatilis]MBO0931415.1 alpha-L-rhamnosidase N-terminal domain-containing protein [Fibrella aquatilis]